MQSPLMAKVKSLMELGLGTLSTALWLRLLGSTDELYSYSALEEVGENMDWPKMEKGKVERMILYS
ncbi:hypothetical protein BVRB_2g033580 [Beta vulgaris subsp. vulgaris]|nr:hypothetical protein BVRB_2g033580 [Beta vulgaris subsp. vulgaris]